MTFVFQSYPVVKSGSFSLQMRRRETILGLYADPFSGLVIMDTARLSTDDDIETRHFVVVTLPGARVNEYRNLNLVASVSINQELADGTGRVDRYYYFEVNYAGQGL